MFIDELLIRLKEQEPILAKHLSNNLKKAIFVNLDNVSDFYYEVSEKETYDLGKDFSNIAPPFNLFWCEYKGPKIVNSGGKLEHTDLSLVKFGVLVETFEIKETNTTFEFGDDSFFLEGVRWKINFHCFWTPLNPQVPSSVGSVSLFIKNDGKIYSNPIKDDGSILQPFCINKKLNDLIKNHKDIGSFMTSKFCIIVLFGIMFFNCKNVLVEENYVSKALRKSRNKKNKFPVVKYYTLNISQQKKIYKNLTESGETFKKALHICRGHFRTYEESAPLFGRLTGTFFVPMHTRGDAKYGEVVKDYKVIA